MRKLDLMDPDQKIARPILVSPFHEQAIARAACRVWRLRQALRSAEEKLDALTRSAPPYLHNDEEDMLDGVSFNPSGYKP